MMAALGMDLCQLSQLFFMERAHLFKMTLPMVDYSGTSGMHPHNVLMNGGIL